MCAAVDPVERAARSNHYGLATRDTSCCRASDSDSTPRIADESRAEDGTHDGRRFKSQFASVECGAITTEWAMN
jgi:hypothetical protein